MDLSNEISLEKTEHLEEKNSEIILEKPSHEEQKDSKSEEFKPIFKTLEEEVLYLRKENQSI